MRLLAIDPGERVGWAHADAEARELRFTGHGITTLREMAVALHDRFADYDVVIMESYTIQPDKARAHIGSSVPTLQFIGMVRLMAWLNPGTKLVLQAPRCKSDAMRSMVHAPADLRGFVDRALASAHDSGHDGDAAMHLWHYYFKHIY